MGTAMGGVIWATLGRVKEGPELTLLMLGSVCFTAGLATYLRLSAVVVCFIAGLIVVNLPSGAGPQLRSTLLRLERPVYLLFLVVTGSLWQGTDWEGWALLLLFVVARFLGRWLAVGICRKSRLGGLEAVEGGSLIVAPMGALSIAIVVSAQDLYSGPTIPWMVTAVIGGAIVSEILVQFSGRAGTPEPQAAGAGEAEVEAVW
jgi:Kef-type K+ transport system membrane component KefB